MHLWTLYLRTNDPDATMAVQCLQPCELLACIWVPFPNHASTNHPTRLPSGCYLRIVPKVAVCQPVVTGLPVFLNLIEVLLEKRRVFENLRLVGRRTRTKLL